MEGTPVHLCGCGDRDGDWDHMAFFGRTTKTKLGRGPSERQFGE